MVEPAEAQGGPGDAADGLLDAAERLFYEKGVQAVGMDEIRAASGIPLKRLYRLYPSKSALLQAYLERRDARWRAELAAYANSRSTPEARILAVFDWLHQWFSEPDFRGCAFVNSFGELGAVDPVVTTLARTHKRAFRDYVAGLVVATGRPAVCADAYALLAEGAITTAAVSGSPEPALRAKEAAVLLLAAT
ncbi:TetR/AcrR family transcriptional regulator [Streptomyces sp. NBC_01433]|uniref:TetR/AcrR family transcriptional regulator n=1 Tax=Streptomyces sp. NBC_01433 TaxID=2903864 RepID=UPI00224E3808|nr:TetR/AcrR family transcriptional regulator [Streptomyces sp. NBC_01433]MCX4680911.1 TetR/AcrR family transcriptional regulator [Streptomyces sp. NBC_01433]